MRNKGHPRTAVASAKPQGPFEERVQAAATNLFDRYGVRVVSLQMIAAEVQTNEPFLRERFGLKEYFVLEYIRSLLDAERLWWPEMASIYPGNPRAQLHEWLRAVQGAIMCPYEGMCHLSMAVAELWDPLPYANLKARGMIKKHKLEERTAIARLCREAGYRQPELLADKLLMLTEGAHVAYGWMGTDGPGVNLLAAAEEILAAHNVPGEAA